MEHPERVASVIMLAAQEQLTMKRQWILILIATLFAPVLAQLSKDYGIIRAFVQ